MMYKLIIGLLAATVPTFFIATANPVVAQRVNISTSQTTVNTITQQIAKLEVERAVQLTRFIPQAPTIRSIDSQLNNLRKRLVQLRPDGNKSAVNIAVSKAIKSKIAELEVERTNQLTKFAPQSPVILQIDAQIKSLQQRLIDK